MHNLLLTIAYDGSGFSGWQRQPGIRTVQGELEKALSVLCDMKVELAGTSRTDSGVHAFGQRATLRGDFSIPASRLVAAANNILSGKRNGPGGDIRILDIEEKEEGFHARFNAMGKKYIYKIHNSQEPDLFRRNYCYHIERPLDVGKMRQAAAFLVGEHDFRCFMSAGGKEPETTVRHIFHLEIKEDAGCPKQAGDITLEIIGNSFLYNMVRILTGTLVEVGLGKRIPEDVIAILDGKDRKLAGHTAPPFGLYLEQVYFQKPWDGDRCCY